MDTTERLNTKDRHPVDAAEGCGPRVRALGLRGPPRHAHGDLTSLALMLGKIEGRRRRGWQRIRWLHGITDSMHMSLSPLGLALGSPIFPSGCEGKLGVALESLQGRRDSCPLCQ